MADTTLSAESEIPVDYRWIDWDHLYAYVGRALLGDHVPLMTNKVADYLEEQAQKMRRTAEKMQIAADVLRATRLPK